MSGISDHQAELDRLNAHRADLRAEYMEAIRQQDMLRSLPSGEEFAPTARPLPEIEADLARIDLQIDDATRAQAQAQEMAVEPQSGMLAEIVMEAGGVVLEAQDVILGGALGGPVGQQIAQAFECVEMQLTNRSEIIDALADSHSRSAETERDNALLDEVRRVDLDPELGKALTAVDEKFELKKQELDNKIDTLQSKFDERQADKTPDDKLALQATLDRQFEAMREQLERAREQERQRVLDEQARQAADLARNRDGDR